MKAQPAHRDDMGAVNFRAKCTRGQEIMGDGFQWSSLSADSWSPYEDLDCPKGTYLCGFRPRLAQDNTGLNQVQVACCEMDEG